MDFTLGGLKLDIFDIMIALGGLYVLYQGITAKYFKIPLSDKLLPKDFSEWKITAEGKEAYKGLLINFIIVLGLYLIVGTVVRALMLNEILPKPSVPGVGAGIIDIVILAGLVVMFIIFTIKDKKLKERYKR